MKIRLEIYKKSINKTLKAKMSQLMLRKYLSYWLIILILAINTLDIKIILSKYQCTNQILIKLSKN